MSGAGTAARKVEIVVVTGMSGSGKSTAINALEDIGFYCIDNLPTALVPRFVELCAETEEAMAHVALGLDLRDVSYAARWPATRQELVAAGHQVSVVFLDAAEEVILRRFSETRRSHPLAAEGGLAESIEEERRALAPLRASASLVVDTSELSVHELKHRIQEMAKRSGRAEAPHVTIKSFGYKYGLAGDSDLVVDVRFLPNPYFVDALRPLDGRVPGVADYVLGRPEAAEFIDRVMDLVVFLLPQYAAEGRSYLTLAVGCTGGRHRSVAIAEECARRLRERSVTVTVSHRDIERTGTP